MSQYETITARVQELIRKYGTRDPFVLAKELGILTPVLSLKKKPTRRSIRY